MPRTLHQTFLMVSDVDESVRFYEEALGLNVAERGDRSAEFDTGRCKLVIEEDFDADTLAGFGLEPPGEKRGDGVIVVLEVDDVDAVYERADMAGADVRMEPRNVDWGRRMFLIADPDGYVLEISRPT
jgi:catechol 2,3-dioxygenase-like lactoylglutathione lyase family enzyme